MSDMEEAEKRCREWITDVLDLSGLDIDRVPDLPEGVTELHCSDTNIRELPPSSIPNLTVLHCSEYETNRVAPVSKSHGTLV